MKFEKLFSKGKIGNVTVKNRIVMSPMGEDMANTDGSVSDQMREYYVRRAEGGTGIIIPGVVSVEYPRGKTESCQSRLDQTKYIMGFARMAQEIHRYGALLIPQLHHAGAATDIQTTEGVTPISITENTEKTDNTGAHVDSDGGEKINVHVATTEELKELEQKFITAAINAKQANCDGVELHGAHSYLIAQLLTPIINNRTDEYGGSVENRTRFAVNIIKGIREKCGPDFIIGIRLSVHKWDSDGLTDEDSLQMAKMLEEAGCDFIDVSGGIPPRPSNLIESEAYEEGYRVDLTEKIRAVVNIPVFALGNIKSPEVAEKILEDDRADYIVMGRALICDPDWANKAHYGKGDEIRKCISCSKGCYGELSQNRFITCALNPEAGYEDIYKKLPEAYSKKKVVIVGGGIAGMQAAITSFHRGHQVVLLEKTDQLGGQIDIASKGQHKERLQWVKQWFVGEIERTGIDVRLNLEANVQDILTESPDAVFLATGSLPFTPPIPGVESTVMAWDVLNGVTEIPTNSSAIVLGGGIVGCEIAEMLADHGNKTIVLEMTPNIAPGLEPFHRIDVLTNFTENENITVLTNAKVTEISSASVKYEAEGEHKKIQGTFIVSAFGQRPVGHDLIEELEQAGIEVTVLGDSIKPGNFMTATRTAYDAAITL